MKTISDETRNPSEDEIFDKVASIVSELFDIEKDEIKMDSRIAEDLGGDELDIVELIMTLEKEFGIILPDEIFMPIVQQESDSDVEGELDEEEDDDVDTDEEDYPDEDIEDEDIEEEDIDEEEDYDYTPSEPYTLTIADYVSSIHKSLNDIED